MTDALDPVSIIEAAQKAADAGDYPTAERLLREAAEIQEATLGSLHPDLASTLNNLAFVCERTNNIADAERGYRGERVHEVMRLRVAATPGTGYRTFSRKTISAERAGDWRVELRAEDGTVLQEQRFAIHIP